MSTAITLATPEHLPQIGALIARRRAEATGEVPDAVTGESVAEPLLYGGPEGAIWLIGPVRAPLGYVVVTFGWSIARGGREAWIDDIFVRDTVRRRGIGREVVHAVVLALRAADVRALHVRVETQDAVAAAFCESAGFRANGGLLLTETF